MWWDIVGGRKMGDLATWNINKQCLLTMLKVPRTGGIW